MLRSSPRRMERKPKMLLRRRKMEKTKRVKRPQLLSQQRTSSMVRDSSQNKTFSTTLSSFVTM